MNTLDQREQAQLGLQYIEDSIVSLLTRHPRGMSVSAVAGVPRLGEDLDAQHRNRIAGGILELLVKSGRIQWDGAAGV